MSNRDRDGGARERAARAAGGVPAPGADDDADGRAAVRADAQRLLRAADDAIARALSSDSERFLQATRQSGGQ